MRSGRFGAYVPGAIVLLLFLPAWWIDERLAWAAYLAAWWFCAGCAMCFLVLKGVEYYKEWHEQLVPGLGFLFGGAHRDGAELFYYLYFVMTGLHALHLTIGITIVAFLSTLLLRGREFIVKPDWVEVTGLYWHFVDVVWIFLFALIYLPGRSGA